VRGRQPDQTAAEDQHRGGHQGPSAGGVQQHGGGGPQGRRSHPAIPAWRRQERRHAAVTCLQSSPQSSPGFSTLLTERTAPLEPSTRPRGSHGRLAEADPVVPARDDPQMAGVLQVAAEMDGGGFVRLLHRQQVRRLAVAWLR
jgi:hypothetical protein